MVLLWHTELKADHSPIPERNLTAKQKTLVLVCLIIGSGMCALNYIPEPIKHTKLVFSAILLSFARGSGWDQLLCVTTKLPAIFLWLPPRFDPLCMGPCNVWPPLQTTMVLQDRSIYYIQWDLHNGCYRSSIIFTVTDIWLLYIGHFCTRLVQLGSEAVRGGCLKLP